MSSPIKSRQNKRYNCKLCPTLTRAPFDRKKKGNTAKHFRYSLQHHVEETHPDVSDWESCALAESEKQLSHAFDLYTEDEVDNPIMKRVRFVAHPVEEVRTASSSDEESQWLSPQERKESKAPTGNRIVTPSPPKHTESIRIRRQPKRAMKVDDGSVSIATGVLDMLNKPGEDSQFEFSISDVEIGRSHNGDVPSDEEEHYAAAILVQMSTPPRPRSHPEDDPSLITNRLRLEVCTLIQPDKFDRLVIEGLRAPELTSLARAAFPNIQSFASPKRCDRLTLELLTYLRARSAWFEAQMDLETSKRRAMDDAGIKLADELKKTRMVVESLRGEVKDARKQDGRYTEQLLSCSIRGGKIS